MVHETTLDASMEEKANARGHSSTRQTATLAREAAVGRLIMTHISSRYDDKGCQRLLAECRAIFPATELAYDFLFSRFSAPFLSSLPITLKRQAFIMRLGWTIFRKILMTGPI